MWIPNGKLSCVLAVVAALALASCSPVAAAAPPPMLQGVHRIVTVGASITQYAARPGGYVWLLRDYLAALYPDQHIEVVDAGVSGNMSSDMLARFKRDVVDRKADLVTIKCGFNDLWRKFTDHPNGDGPGGHTADEYGAFMGKMVDMSQAARIRVLLMTPTIWEDAPDTMHNQKLEAYVEVVRDLARRRNLPLADQNAALTAAWETQRKRPADQQVRLTTDQVHLTDAGDAVVARTTLLAMGISAADLDAAAPQVRIDLGRAAKH